MFARPFVTQAVADPSVLHNVVTPQDAEGVDLLLEVRQGRLLVGLQLLHCDLLARVVTQRVIKTKFNTSKVSLERCRSQ